MAAAAIPVEYAAGKGREGEAADDQQLTPAWQPDSGDPERDGTTRERDRQPARVHHLGNILQRHGMVLSPLWPPRCAGGRSEPG